MTGHDDDPLSSEEVERRRELRGTARDLRLHFGAPIGESFPALEASRRSFFVGVESPDRFALGEVLEAQVANAAKEAAGEGAAVCRLEVIRKEIVPRRGVALRLVFIDPANEDLLRDLLGPLAET